MSIQPETDYKKRRNFTSLLILANFFRVLAYVIVAVATVLVGAALAAALASHSGDTLLQQISGSAWSIFYALGLFLASELIRLMVGIAKDVSRMSGRGENPALREAPALEPIKPAT